MPTDLEQRQAVRAAHMRFEHSSNPRDALDYLIAVRDLMFLQTPPAHYRQLAHSDDQKPVRGNPKLPALLDASYHHFGRNLSSLSFPRFVAQDVSEHGFPWRFKKDSQGKEQPEIIHGFNSSTLSECVKAVLTALHIKLDSRDEKIGYDNSSQTHYVEISAATETDYQKGRKLIHMLVHGDDRTDRRLHALIMRADGRADPSPPKTAWHRVGRSLLARIPMGALRTAINKGASYLLQPGQR